MLTAAALTMFFANEVWAVYGIGIQSDDGCAECWPARMQQPLKREEKSSVPSDTPTPTTHPSTHTGTPRSIPLIATHSSTGIQQLPSTETLPSTQPSATPTAPSPTLTPSTSPLLSASPPATTGEVDTLETGVKIGIGVIVSFIGIALIILLVETCYLRKKRREKALQRAVQEVERGERGLTKGSEEIVVLESRVSIVFDDGEEDEEGEEQERGRTQGRNGMSLARRQY